MLGSRLAVVRTAMVAFAAAAAGAVAFAAPASADVTLTPTEAVQADAARLAFQVTTDPGAAPTTKVQVTIPEATPIAEVYPMSNPDWAPALTERKLDKPIEAIHGTRTTEVVTMVTWTARPGWQLPAGQPAVLDVELGPLPETDQVVFTVTQTHADGAVDPPRQMTLKLGPPPAGQAQGQSHDAHGGTGAQPADGGAAQAPAEDGSGCGGTTLAVIISVLVIGLAGGAVFGTVVLPRLRRGAAGLTVSPGALDARDDEEAPAEEAPAEEPARR